MLEGKYSKAFIPHGEFVSAMSAMTTAHLRYRYDSRHQASQRRDN